MHVKNEMFSISRHVLILDGINISYISDLKDVS